ncbi:immunoglobulin lambda-1 light chain isoform X1 [Oreochromis niloticus]|uniref:immunoglobulin lambda-1 light chain isoform X1 n=1 Tax=Oreochromis niloticus TaxID=8128 RepID=UPI000DF3B25A|nr:immunoglobulin lambda-1 light chain isoform X1 [Oreochromis niloticus]
MISTVFLIYFLQLIGKYGVSSTYTVLQTPPSIIKKVGQSVSSQIHCSHNVSIFDRILWYKQDEHRALKFLGYLNGEYPYPEDDVKGKISFDGNARKHSNLTISNVSVTDSAVYFCAATSTNTQPAYFGQGTKLTVLEQDPITPNVTVLAPSVNECKNKKDKKRKKTLVCVASGFYPDHVEVYWQMNEKNVTDGVATDEAAERIETPLSYRITSRLRVSAKDWFTEGKKFTCIVSFNSRHVTTKHHDTILGVEDKEDRGTGREKYLKITNKAKLSYAVFIFKSCLYGGLCWIFGVEAAEFTRKT